MEDTSELQRYSGLSSSLSMTSNRADPASREVLDVLSLRLGAHQLMLIASERTEETQSGRTALAREDSNLLLEGLNQADYGRTVRAWVGYEVPGTFTRALWTRTMGNPFFVSEILAHLRDSGLVYRRGRAMALDSSSVDAVRLTSNIADVLGRRVLSLPPPARVMLQAHMAVLRWRLPRKPTSRATRDWTTGLCKRQWILRERRDGNDDSADSKPALKFRHDLMREFVYREIPDEDRRLFHAQAATMLEAAAAASEDRHLLAAIAVHLIEAGQAADRRKRFQFTQAAGDAAFSVFAYEDAVKYWREALSIMEESLAPPADRRRAS